MHSKDMIYKTTNRYKLKFRIKTSGLLPNRKIMLVAANLFYGRNNRIEKKIQFTETLTFS